MRNGWTAEINFIILLAIHASIIVEWNIYLTKNRPTQGQAQVQSLITITITFLQSLKRTLARHASYQFPRYYHSTTLFQEGVNRYAELR